MSPIPFLAFTALAALTLPIVTVSAESNESPVKLDEAAAVPFPKLIYSFNTQLLTATAFHGITYGGPQIAGVVEDLKPYGLRFPGGTVANNYRWQEDSFSQQKGDLTKWASKQFELFRKAGRKYDLRGFASLCRKKNIEPIWVLNIYEETPESVGELLAYLDSIDLDLRYLELGNEPYWDPRSHNDVEAYIEYCRPLVAAIRAKKPDVKIGACFGPVNKPGQYEEKWNAPLAAEDWYDAIVYHEYYGGQGFALEAGVSTPIESMLHPDGFVAEVARAMETARPGLPVWFTEWNIGSKGIKEWKNSGAELLFIAAATQQLFVRSDLFEWGCFHQLYQSTFGTLEWNPKTSHLDTMASYQVFRLLGDAFAGATELIPTTVGDSNDALALAVSGTNGYQLLVINRGAKDLSLTLPDNFNPGSLKIATIDCGPPMEKLPINTDLIAESRAAGSIVTLPAYSISRISSQ